MPPLLTQALALERAIYGHPTELAIDKADASAAAAINTGAQEEETEFDAVIDLAGLNDTLPRSRRLLMPLFNSVPGEIGAVAALFSEGPVTIELYDSSRAAISLTALPATSDRQVLTRALDGVLSRAIDLILKALCQTRPTDTQNAAQPPVAPAHRMPALAATPFGVLHRLGAKLIAFIGRTAAGGHSWAVAYRLSRTACLFNQQPATFTVLRDDRRRFYADPFPFVHRGRRYLFFEEFPFATQRGCISVATVDEGGHASAPRIVLETPHHLSYPFVFEHAGDIWMIPESGAANRIDLYRADRFPDRWTHESTLIDNIRAHDTTLMRHNGRFWLFTSLARWGSTSWDSLSLFHATSLFGPWVAHAENPVLLDARKSRSGGAFFTHNGATLHPVQDCTRCYGGELAFHRIDALSPTDFRQTEVGRLASGMRGCHTYNRRGDLETIDVFDATRDLTHVDASYLSADQTPHYRPAEPAQAVGPGHPAPVQT
ncbi:hypothetical protein MXD81_41915 [Microbacteriaceae bacterium K1510]|nr:hypothetical protein [Microbacteriaceae bacterium K1510]